MGELPAPPPVFSTLNFSGAGQELIGFEGVSAVSVIADPTTGAAAGNKVVSYTELANAKNYAGASLGLDSTYSVDPIPFDVAAKETVMSARVWVNPAYGVGKVVRMQVADTAGTNDAHYVEAQATTTQSGWNTLVFDFSQPVSRYVAALSSSAATQLANGVSYDKISLFIDWDNGYAWDGAGVGIPPAQDRTYYIDDVSFVGELPDTTSPTVTSFSPVDGATGVSASANIVLNFSELVFAREGGTIQLMTDYNFNHQMIEEIAVNDTSKVQINGNVVTINPSADFQTGTGYHLDFLNAFADGSANAFSYPHGNYNFVVL